MKNILLLFLFPFILFSQQKQDYTRSSIHLHLVDDFDFDNGEYVLKSYDKYFTDHFPENYNDHSIDLRKIKLTDWELTDAEKEAAGKNDDALGAALSDGLTQSTGGLLKIQDNSLVKLQLDKYIGTEKIAHRLVKKWFTIDEDGNFGTGLLNTRSLQNKSQELTALQGAADVSGDVFNNLINNTFVVFTRLYYVSNEVVASVIRDAAYVAADNLGGGIPTDLAKKAADKIYTKTSEGYSVWTTAWLYKLDWNEEKFNEFLTTINQETNKINLEKFNSLDLKLTFLSQEKATSLVTFSLKEEDKNRTEQDVFDKSTIRNIDKVLVVLQKKNDVFKPIFPLRDGFSVAAGTKEGIEDGDVFEVLETKDGKYNRIGTMKVDGKKIWNNSFEPGKDVEAGLTYFKKGDKKFIPGIHYVRFVK